LHNLSKMTIMIIMMSLVHIHIRRLLPIILVVVGVLTLTVPVAQAQNSVSDCVDFSHMCCMGSSDASSSNSILSQEEVDLLEKPSCCEQPLSSETSNGIPMISDMAGENDLPGQMEFCLGSCSLPSQPVGYVYHLQSSTYTWGGSTTAEVSFVFQDSPQTSLYKTSNPPLRFIDWCCLRL